MKKLLLLVALFAGHLAFAQSPAVKVALAKLDDDQKAVLLKVTNAAGMPRVNTVYYGSFLVQTVSAVRNSVNALPIGKKVTPTSAQLIAIDLLDAAVAKFTQRTTPYNDSTESEMKTILAQLDGSIPTPALVKALLIKQGNQGFFTVKVDGDFTRADIDTANVTISNAKPRYSTAAYLEFKLTAEQAVLPTLKDPFSWHRYTISIPYTISSGKKRKKVAKVAEYEFLGCTFPAKPGKLDVATTKSNGSVEVQHKRTRTFLLNSTRENLVEKQCLPKAESGYTVITETAQLEIESSKGQQKRDWNYQRTSSGGNVCFVVETFYNKGGESGKLEFYIKYDVKRNATESDNQVATESYDMEWGDVKEITVAGSKPEITYTDYKGDKITVSKDTIAPNGPMVKMTDKKITITMPDVQQLVKPTTTTTP